MRIDAPAGAAPPARLPLIDAARGTAVLAMIVYHFAWDLGFFGLIEVDVAEQPGWRLFARSIAGSFLLLVGVGLVLASRRGIDPKSFLRRLAVLALAAGAITLATYLTFPDAFIFFGILHCIAVSSVLALPFLRLPPGIVLAAAAAALAAPWLVSGPAFDAPALWWLGLMQRTPLSNDYTPIFPWFGAVLAGVALARIALARSPAGGWTRWRPGSAPGRAAVWVGRRSLAIYLLHQPVLIGGLMAATELMG